MNTLNIILASLEANCRDGQIVILLEELINNNRNNLISELVEAHLQAKNGLNKETADRVLKVLNTLMTKE